MMRAAKKDACTDGRHETVALLLAPAAIGKDAGFGCAVRIDAASGFQGGRLVRRELGVVLSLELILFGEVLDCGLPAMVGKGRGELLNRHGCPHFQNTTVQFFLDILRSGFAATRRQGRRLVPKKHVGYFRHVGYLDTFYALCPSYISSTSHPAISSRSTRDGCHRFIMSSSLYCFTRPITRILLSCSRSLYSY